MENAYRSIRRGLDIIIDDASHLYKKSRASFDILFENHLKSGGMYIIEDWGCGYWPKWPNGHRDGVHGLPKLIKELVDEVAIEDRSRLYKGKRAMHVNGVQTAYYKTPLCSESYGCFV